MFFIPSTISSWTLSVPSILSISRLSFLKPLYLAFFIFPLNKSYNLKNTSIFLSCAAPNSISSFFKDEFFIFKYIPLADKTVSSLLFIPIKWIKFSSLKPISIAFKLSLFLISSKFFNFLSSISEKIIKNVFPQRFFW